MTYTVNQLIETCSQIVTPEITLRANQFSKDSAAYVAVYEFFSLNIESWSEELNHQNAVWPFIWKLVIKGENDATIQVINQKSKAA
jgi:hypothetical protein